MTSKISFYKLMKEDLRHRLWMAALSCFGSIMTLPVLFLFASAYTSRFNAAPPLPGYIFELVMNYFQKHCSNFHGIIVILGAIIAAVFGFRYLFSKKMVNLYHCAPIKRQRLFLVHYVDGILIWLIPYLAGMVLTLVIACIYLPVPSYWPSFFLAAGRLTVHFLFSYLIVYHVSLVAVMISGNLLNAFINLLLLGTGAAGIFLLIVQMFHSFMDTYIRLPLELPHVLWLSPLASAVYYQLFNSKVSGNVFFICSCLVMAAVNFIAARKLYLKRPSELAEQGLRNSWFTALLRLLTAYLCGLTPVWLILVVLSYGFNRFIGWCVFASIIGCFLGHGIIQIIYTMNFKNFLAKKKQLGAVTAFTAFTILAFYFDWFGYDSRLPDPADMESAQINLSSFEDYSDYLPSGEAGMIMSRQKAGDKIAMDYTDTEQLNRLLTSIIDNQQGGYIYDIHTFLNVDVKLKNGNHFYRHYKVSADDMELLRPIIESETYKQNKYAMSSGSLGLPSRVEIRSTNYKTTYNLTEPEEIAGLMNAYYSDFNNNYTMENLSGNFSVSNIEIAYKLKDSQILQHYTLSVPDYYTETIAALKAISPDTVLDQSQLEPTSIQIAPFTSTWTVNLKADLYTYFGYDQAPEEVSQGQTDSPAAEETYSDSSSSRANYTIDDPDRLKELTAISRVALNYQYTVFSKEYIRAGTLTYTDGTNSDLYVEPGTFPLDIIDSICRQSQ